jgi:Tfp pilus assembly protein PilO
MNLAGLELSKREGILLGAAGGLGVLFLFYWLSTAVAGDPETRPPRIRENLQVAAQELERNSTTVTNLTKNLGLGKFQLPSTEDSAKVLSHIDKIAKSNGLGYSALTAQVPKKGKNFQTITYRFTSNSELKALIKFVDEIQHGEYLICLENWDMKAGDDPKIVQANVTLRAYFKPARAEAMR